MTYPPRPLQQPQVAAPPVSKTPVTCCGYTCLQGTPQRWECPGCHKVWEPPGRQVP